MDVDENSLSATDSEQHHQLLKAGQSPSSHDQMATLRSQLTNGNFGMEDSDNSNESPLKLKDEEEVVDNSDQKDEEDNQTSTSDKNQPLDLNCEQLNGSFDNFAAAELSPSLRRSTRASALKAQEKIRFKDGAPTMVDSHVAENGPVATTQANDLSAQTTAADADQQMEIPIKKKRKLSENETLDQFDCKFGIRLDADGDVVMMTDGSEISSLNEEEATALHQKYNELKNLEDTEATFEKKKEQEFQVRDLESSLRQEEAKLAMLKKIRANQQLTARNAMQENARRLTSNISQNAGGTAYKPPIAQSTNKLNGNLLAANSKNQRNKNTKPSTSPAGNFQLTPQHQQILQKLLEQGQLRPEQLATILHSLNPAALTALSQASTKTQQNQREQDQKLREQREREQKVKMEQETQRKAAVEAAESARLVRENAQNTQQRIASARTQLRRHLEQQLLQLPPPKAPVPDLSFIPNATQPDFLYLLGLDLVVQRNLKDKTVFKKVDFDPYECEECGTDFTPNWKAISGDKDDLHLYCEQCVRQAQKRKVRHERTILYKKAFQKIAEQEKEFERQVSAGKFNDTPATSSSKDSSGTSAHNSNLSNKASNFNAAALSGLSHSASSLAAANRGVQNSFASLNKPKQEPPKKQLPPPPAARKRPNPTSSSGSSNMNSGFASLASNPNTLRMLQQMSNMPGALNNMNPMLASIMSSPQLMSQFYNHMLGQQQSQQQETPRQQQRAVNSSNSNNTAVSAILQAIAQTHGSRNTPSSSSSNHNVSSSSHHQSSNHNSHSNHNNHQSSSSSNSNASNILSQMTPALLQQLVAAASQRKK